MAKTFFGPEDLADAILAARHEPLTVGINESNSQGKISENGVRRLILIAYYGSQATNEGRYPRLTFLVPAIGQEDFSLLVPLNEELFVGLLSRIGPAVSSRDHSLVVHEDGDKLQVVGIAKASFVGHLTRAYLRPRGLTIEVSAPGEIRASEHRTHCLKAGLLYPEVSFVFYEWFQEWCAEAAEGLDETVTRVGEKTGLPFRPGMAFANVWLSLLQRAVAICHGGCFVILSAPREPLILKHAFSTPDCNLGEIINVRTWMLLKDILNPLKSGPDAATDRADLRQMVEKNLDSTIDAIAHLSATDGCVVFDRKLQLHSFGTMIEAKEQAIDDVPCFLGNTTDRINGEQVRSFGARRRSALQLCRACPDAMAFVISQDGDLRVFVRDKDVVRFFDRAAYW